ncbi:bifunctional DNA primase/polymerase [Mycolicibacterium frederiksbergense]|uniref:bifunctional DNA primase/polymerase n=1 Tax=Mycolicibacterium frederiksbergense TaxID=117567 RepID=UPI00265C3273|nr:bifunctional DNA primase/polymerase [Mycolicibacterium frederiksbergense]MDO0977177.1 bifunctional DNA primase/polymerase [Mycolicibacterium frederiksbergense]
MLDHALAYAAAGIPVLALKTRSKAPATAHGKDDATTDADTIARWWTRNPHSNIGLRPTTEMLVVDVDPRNGGDMSLLDRLPETWTAETGSGGLHIWLRAGGQRLRSTLTEGVDLKTTTGYLVAPPSIHPNGNVYRWLNRAPIAHAPGWLLDKAARPKPPPPQPFNGTAGRREDGLIAAVAEANEGARNGVLYWAACRAVESGAYRQIRDAIADAARSAGLSDREIDATLQSAERRAAV